MLQATKMALSSIALTVGILAGGIATTAQAESSAKLRFAGALEFSDAGTLFVGDNYAGTIYAFDLTAATAPAQVKPVNIGDIDIKIADALGVPKTALAINDMAVHPVSAEIYISVSRIGNFESAPAIVRIAQDASIELLDLSELAFQKQPLTHYPDQPHSGRVDWVKRHLLYVILPKGISR